MFCISDQKLQKASNDEQLLLIHDTEKILGHHDRYFPGGKPLEITPSAMLPQLDNDEVILHNIVKSRNIDDLIRFLEVIGATKIEDTCARVRKGSQHWAANISGRALTQAERPI